MEKFNKGISFSMVFMVIFAMILAGVASFHFYMGALPPISQLNDYQPNLVSQFVSCDGEVIKTYTSYKFRKIDLNEIPDNLKQAIIATEDKNFYKHDGFDFFALLRSIFSNLQAGRVVQGASTITQQLARILFLSSEKTYDRKIKELIIARRLEKTLTKDEILGMYLNTVYLGEGAYGVSAASEIYFNKKVKDLTLAEAALIAGLPQAPSAYTPYRNMDLALKRRAKVLDRMVRNHAISRKEAEIAKKKPININKDHHPYSLNKAPYFIDLAIRELDDLGITEKEITQNGYKIYTTLNYKYQSAAQESLTRNLKNWGLNEPHQQAALMSYDASTGKILAYIGGKNYKESQFDRVSQAIRQPGSSFKMFVYATAMENGFTPNDIYDDEPITIGDWSPRNYGGKYRGKIPLHTALALSSNVIAARLIMEVGVRDTILLAKRLGITTPLAKDPTIALGSSGVKLVEMTGAYGVLANGGIKVKPYAIEKVETSNGKVIYRAEQKYERVLDTRTVNYVVQMLKQVIKLGTGRAANIDRPMAGKTGTTDNYRDAWFIGFTPDIVTGVWVGNDNNTPTKKLTGGSVPAVIWRDYMKKVIYNKPILDFAYPEIEIQMSEIIPDVKFVEEEYDEENQLTDKKSAEDDIEKINSTQTAPTDLEQNKKESSTEFKYLLPVSPQIKERAEHKAPPKPPLPVPNWNELMNQSLKQSAEKNSAPIQAPPVPIPIKTPPI
ncbi:MAG: penicillin-binding protein 1A, partial [Candidatus Gastranaerophilales bacterium]|nr:penicillin-binding protein 1A [Candidatus Gastranaerophilales bacterium]